MGQAHVKILRIRVRVLLSTLNFPGREAIFFPQLPWRRPCSSVSNNRLNCTTGSKHFVFTTRIVHCPFLKSESLGDRLGDTEGEFYVSRTGEG
jgi:hypothetical protein